MRQTQAVKGFTLTELIITMALIALLTAIAIPSYQTYVIRSNRSDAESQLLQLGQAMERYYTANDSYLTTSGGIPSPSSLGPYSQSPATGTAVYNITITDDTTATYYKLKASPDSHGINKSDGDLTLDSIGNKTWGSKNNWNQ